jgi:hypothetical protein
MIEPVAPHARLASVNDFEFAQAIARERTRARIAIAFLAIILLLELASIALYAERVMVLEAIRVKRRVQPWAEASDRRVQIWAIVTVLFQIPVALTFFMWVHTAYGNLRRVGSAATRWTPGWAVGYWFIPFLNVVRSFQIVKEIAVRTADSNARDDRKGESAPMSVALWYTFYVVSALLIRGATSQNEPGLQALLVATETLAGATFLRIAAGVALIVIILPAARGGSGGDPAG